MAAKSFSVQLASTDLKQHHRFLRDAEALRFDFVQMLNQLHVDELSYADDIRRNEGEEGNKRARVSSENWRLLKTFPWQPNSTMDRLAESLPQFLVCFFGGWVLRCLVQPEHNDFLMRNDGRFSA